MTAGWHTPLDGFAALPELPPSSPWPESIIKSLIYPPTDGDAGVWEGAGAVGTQGELEDRGHDEAHRGGVEAGECPGGGAGDARGGMTG